MNKFLFFSVTFVERNKATIVCDARFFFIVGTFIYLGHQNIYYCCFYFVGSVSVRFACIKETTTSEEKNWNNRTNTFLWYLIFWVSFWILCWWIFYQRQKGCSVSLFISTPLFWSIGTINVSSQKRYENKIKFNFLLRFREKKAIIATIAYAYAYDNNFDKSQLKRSTNSSNHFRDKDKKMFFFRSVLIVCTYLFGLCIDAGHDIFFFLRNTQTQSQHENSDML